ELATNTETQTGTDTSKAVTPASLTSRTATDARAGIVELATNTETQTGTDATKAVTPASLASLTANDTRSGLVELATNTETQTGTDSTRAVTPASLASRTATDARAGIVELADNAETQAGTDSTRAVTPASLASASALFVPPGAVMQFAMTNAPSGWLAANGQTIGNASSGSNFSSAIYSDLFAVLWTNWSNTLLPILTSTGVTSSRGTSASADFAANKRLPLPDLRGYFIRGSGTNSDNTASGTFGTKQADALKSHSHGYSKTTPNGDGSLGLVSSSTISNTENGVTVTDNTATGDASTGASSETRPKNIALLYCIKI
ncbi:hypothetical protein EBU02_08150, partial [bacterium]|nr:hypothetical protein [bacterium]